MADALSAWFDDPKVAAAIRERDGVVLEHAVTPYDATTWLRHVGSSPAAVAVVERFAGKSITRGDLRDHAVAALGRRDDVAWVKLFMACQLWGIGTSGRVGWTAETLADETVPEAFANLAQAVEEGEYWRAAGKWATGWNISFTTKFAYAVSLALDSARPQAVIFDDRVRDQLETIGWQRPEAGPGKRKRWRRYAGYCEKLHQEADRLGCRPDTLEWVLFWPPE